MRLTPPTRSREQGVALVTTVIVVAVMAVVAVAFMQSTTVDRMSSRSAANYTRAKLAADAGASASRAMVVDLIRRYPDSVTVWQNIGGGSPAGTNNEATVLYVRARSEDTNLGASPGAFGNSVVFLAQPLVSRTNTTSSSPATNRSTLNTNLLPLAAAVSSVPVVPGVSVDINRTNALLPDPFVGRRSSTNPGVPVTAAQWIYMTNSAGETNARFAFWIEDESFKVNVNVATNGPRGASSLGLSAAEVRVDGSWLSSTNGAVTNSDIVGMVAGRTNLSGSNFPTVGTAALFAGISSVNAADEVRFLTTTYSAGLDLSRGGFRRFNLNTVTNGDKRAALDRIIAAITNTNAAPLFGQRFYRTNNSASGINAPNAVSPDHANIYLQKIAANVYDYLDSDDQPTVISNNAAFNLITGRPNTGIHAVGGGLDGPNTIAAMGVENVPRLQEYAVHMRLRSMRWDPAMSDSFGFISTSNTNSTPTLPVPTQATYEIWLDHYFEFWNPGTRDFTNSPDTFLKIFDQPAWGPVGRVTGPITSNNRTSSEIPLVDAVTGEPVVFPAGQVTVLTTAPITPAPALNVGANPASFLVAPDPGLLVPLANVPLSDRVFTGTTSYIAETNYEYESAAAAFSGGPDFGYDRLFEVSMLPRSTTVTDYQSGVLIGNNQGIIESFVGLPIGANLVARVGSSWARNDLSPHSLNNGQMDNIRGGSLYGNSSATSRPSPYEGDPRSLLEQLEFLNHTRTGGIEDNPNLTRFGNTIPPRSGTDMFVNNSLGRPNTNYVLATNWTDSSSILPGDANAPLVIRNGPMQTIGELGHITDPARPYYTVGSAPVLARGGGRTLRIGQSELTNSGGANIGWYAGGQTNASRTWTAWRLADIFTVTTNTNVAIAGLINPNGALRDNGAALRAAVYRLTFLPAGPDGAISTASRPINTTASSGSSGLLPSLISRLTSHAAGGLPAGSLNPFWERGEISELGVFNAAAGGIAAGVNMSNTFDRGREEVVRRSIEMITTRGSVFTAYVIGQSLRMAGSSTNITGTVRMKTTFELIPQFSPGATNDAFDRGDAAQRFAPATNYTTRILFSTYD